MNDWWKDPRLDDEGTYDYLAEKLPEDNAKWEFDKYAYKCDRCGKERHLLFRATHYFYCWDGWDSMDYADCWVCRLKIGVRSFKDKIKKRVKIFKTALELYKISPKWNLKKSYECAKKLER